MDILFDYPGLTRDIVDNIALFIAIVLIIIILYVSENIIYTSNTYSATYTAEITEIGDIMMNFHKDPDYDDFMYVWKNKKKIPSKTYKCWIYGISQSQPHFIDYARETNRGFIFSDNILSQGDIREVERVIRRVQVSPTGELMDCIWAIYSATGDTKYSDLVGAIARGEIISDRVVRSSASWSYKSIMGIRP
jgi:hypothetical protein